MKRTDPSRLSRTVIVPSPEQYSKDPLTQWVFQSVAEEFKQDLDQLIESIGWQLSTFGDNADAMFEALKPTEINVLTNPLLRARLDEGMQRAVQILLAQSRLADEGETPENAEIDVPR